MPCFNSVSVSITQEDIDYAAQFRNPCPLSPDFDNLFC